MEPKGIFEDTLIGRVRLTNLQVEDIEQKEDFVYTETVNEESSQVREIELEHSDDISLESKAFYLEKVRDYKDNTGYHVACPILHGRAQMILVFTHFFFFVRLNFFYR